MRIGSDMNKLVTIILKAFVWSSFMIYVAIVFCLVFLAYDRGGWSDMSIMEYALFQMNIIPFRTIGTYIRVIAEGSLSLPHPVANLLGNFMLFFPLGIYLPLFSERLKSWKTYAATLLCILLGIEVVQFFTRRGVFDIDDLILNASGAMLGFLFWKSRLLQWFERKYKGRS